MAFYSDRTPTRCSYSMDVVSVRVYQNRLMKTRGPYKYSEACRAQLRTGVFMATRGALAVYVCVGTV